MLLPVGAHAKLNGLGRRIAVDASDDLLDLHEMERGRRALLAPDERPADPE
jgi:hypothetical protein